MVETPAPYAPGGDASGTSSRGSLVLDAGFSGPLMLFDGICNFCSGGALFVLTRSRGSRLHFCAMQTEAGRAVLTRLGLPLSDYETVVLIADGQVLIKSAAVLGLAAYMDYPWPLIARALHRVPRSLRDWLYDRVAANRFRIAGRRTQCIVPDGETRRRFLA
jgi:predicted DCC family thiol-disulfide oxidoreductase YuxK